MIEILILSAGRRVSLVRAFQAAARPHGIRVATADLRPHMSSACHVSEKNVELPHVLDKHYSQALIEYCTKNEVKLLIPTIDTELATISSLKSELLAVGCITAVSDIDFINTCRDKRETAKFFESLGVKSPEIYPAGQHPYPVFVKPYDGSLSAGISILRNQSELTTSTLNNPKNIYCQYLDPSEYEEYTCDAYFNANHSLVCVVPRLRIEVRGGEVSKGRTERNNIVSFLFEKLRRIDGARGCLTIQIMRHRQNGDLYLIEVNPRFGGGYPLTAKAGAPYHEWLISEYINGQPIGHFDSWTDKLTMLRFDSEVFIDDA